MTATLTPIGAPARAIGLLAWSSSRRDADDAPVGGLVVEVLDTPDPATGEKRVSYLTIDPHRTRPRLVWHVLTEDDVDPTTTEAAPTSTLASVIRRLCEEVAMRERYKHRTGRFDPSHITLVAYAYRLAGAL